MSRAGRSLRLVAGALVVLSLTGCLRGCPSSRPPIHINPNMDDQPRVNAQQASSFFHDGRAMREPIPGTVARGELRTEPPSFYTGKDETDAFLATSPLAVSDDVLARGLRQYTIYCQPCHEKRGTGKGIMTEYGGVPVPAYEEERLVLMPDGEIFDVITNSKGLMKGYGYTILPRDRWAIIHHVRRLQQERIQALAARGARGGAP